LIGYFFEFNLVFKIIFLGIVKMEKYKWNMYQTTAVKLSNWKPGDIIKNG
jgi:hypothetical protein